MVEQNHYIKKENIEFTERELEIMELICKEMSNRDIAQTLHLSVRTVEWYKEQLLQKTGSKNTVGILLFAIKKGIVKID